VQHPLLGVATWQSRGQALVEMAIITPLLLLFVVGIFQVGVAVLTATRLQHAAQQGVAAGALEAVPQRCATAETAAVTVYGAELVDMQCTQPGNVLTLSVSDLVPQVSPFGPWTFSATARAVTP
jgi:Flp pilus assembly protein TadG